MSRKKEYCYECGREYDGHYPCLCGSVNFTKEPPKFEEVKQNE